MLNKKNIPMKKNKSKTHKNICNTVIATFLLLLAMIDAITGSISEVAHRKSHSRNSPFRAFVLTGTAFEKADSLK